MVVGPGYFETVRQLFKGLTATGRPDQETCGCGAYSADHRENLYHAAFAPFIFFLAGSRSLRSWMQQGRDALEALSRKGDQLNC